MNHNKKHTPLTAEELVKLLDIHANNETDLTELDDFEKEALEGFSAHTSAETAKDLMNEVQSDISKKVSNRDTAAIQNMNNGVIDESKADEEL